MSYWIIVGISGVTNGGKSTLTRKLLETFPGTVKVINQDDYFYPEDSHHHVPAPGDIKHHNWDIISSLDMQAMTNDVLDVINSKVQTQSKSCPGGDSYSNKLDADSSSSGSNDQYHPVLLLDGFLLYDDEKLANLCNLKYFLTLNRDQCWERRKTRVYDPPDPQGYFDSCVWPMYESYLKRVKKTSTVVFLDGTKDPYKMVYQEVMSLARLSQPLQDTNEKAC